MKFFAQAPDGTEATVQPIVNARVVCKHRGTKLSVAPCCGQMFACNFHKGRKCAPVGIAKPPFLSCSVCSDFDPVNWLAGADNSDSHPRVGFISAAFAQVGGPETFHCTLIPRLRNLVNVIGFVATAFSGGDGSKLMVPYATGLQAARELTEVADVVVTWGISNLSDVLPANRPKVIAVHHSDWSSDWSNDTIVKQLELVDEVVCVNAEVAERISQYGKRTHYIPNAVDPERIQPSGNQSALRLQFGIPEASRIVLFGHRLSAEKRPSLAAEIGRHLPDDWVMVIAGDGTEKANVERIATGCDRIRIVGHCESLADWLAISECFLSLSTFEGFGLSVCEALMAGVPTVSTATGIAPGLAITLPTESTVTEWAAAIVNSHQIVSAGDIAKMFSVDRMVNKWTDAIARVGQ